MSPNAIATIGWPSMNIQHRVDQELHYQKINLPVDASQSSTANQNNNDNDNANTAAVYPSSHQNKHL